MIIGVLIGVFAKDVQKTFDTVDFHGVSVREHLYFIILNNVATQSVFQQRLLLDSSS